MQTGNSEGMKVRLSCLTRVSKLRSLILFRVFDWVFQSGLRFGFDLHTIESFPKPSKLQARTALVFKEYRIKILKPLSKKR